ncbi:hypothetical protein [Bacillus mojavensis]
MNKFMKKLLITGAVIITTLSVGYVVVNKTSSSENPQQISYEGIFNTTPEEMQAEADRRFAEAQAEAQNRDKEEETDYIYYKIVESTSDLPQQEGLYYLIPPTQDDMEAHGYKNKGYDEKLDTKEVPRVGGEFFGWEERVGQIVAVKYEKGKRDKALSVDLIRDLYE